MLFESLSVSHLLIVDLSACANGVLFRKSFPVPTSSSLFPTFSSIRSRVSGLMLMSLKQLDWNFVQAARDTDLFLFFYRQLSRFNYLFSRFNSLFACLFVCFILLIFETGFLCVALEPLLELTL